MARPTTTKDCCCCAGAVDAMRAVKDNRPIRVSEFLQQCPVLFPRFSDEKAMELGIQISGHLGKVAGLAGVKHGVNQTPVGVRSLAKLHARR